MGCRREPRAADALVGRAESSWGNGRALDRSGWPRARPSPTAATGSSWLTGTLTEHTPRHPAVVEVPASHSNYVSQPAAVADLINKAASEVSRPRANGNA
jgi:hypothetical protein